MQAFHGFYTNLIKLGWFYSYFAKRLETAPLGRHDISFFVQWVADRTIIRQQSFVDKCGKTLGHGANVTGDRPSGPQKITAHSHFAIFISCPSVN